MNARCSATCVVAAWLALAAGAPLWAGKAPPELADLTRDGNAARMVADENVLNHTYNLGPTGMRGWIYSEGAATDRSRQILVTLVEEGSPAHGIIDVGDVILGIGNNPFPTDARIGFARAIAAAESEQQQGTLRLLVWRQGEQLPLQLKLKVMGTYSDTAPYGALNQAGLGCFLAMVLAEQAGVHHDELDAGTALSLTLPGAARM